MTRGPRSRPRRNPSPSRRSTQIIGAFFVLFSIRRIQSIKFQLGRDWDYDGDDDDDQVIPTLNDLCITLRSQPSSNGSVVKWHFRGG